MTNSLFRDETLDDVMRSVIEEVQKSGYRIHPSKGECMELAGVLLELTNPRARLSRTETRGKPFSCLGELCWYLAKTNDLDLFTITYQLTNTPPMMARFMADMVHVCSTGGAYTNGITLREFYEVDHPLDEP